SQMFPNLVFKEPDIITAKKPMGMRPHTEMKPQSKAPPLQSNPFKLPANIFRYSLEEEEKRRLERIQERTKQPHEKMTFRHRFIAKRLSLQQKLGQCEKVEEATCTDMAADPLQQDANWRKHFQNKDGGDRTSIRDFVADQRKAFLQGAV
ncbi:hypothetical protein NFI96_022163, partial [Prochilodus magdalenae]